MSEDRSRTVMIKRTDEEQRIVYGEVYAPGVLDTYGEFMFADDIRDMAYKFMQKDLANVIDTNHDNIPNGSFPVESFIARAGDPDFTEGAWVMGVKVPDDNVWQAVKDGKINGFSFEAMVKVMDVEIEYHVLRDHFGDTEESNGHSHVYHVQVDEKGVIIGGHTDEVNGHSHKIVRGSHTLEAEGHSHRVNLR